VISSKQFFQFFQMQEIDEKINFQPEAKLIPDQLWDVVIIGAGPLTP
jgi:hypothetical protein